MNDLNGDLLYFRNKKYENNIFFMKLANFLYVAISLFLILICLKIVIVDKIYGGLFGIVMPFITFLPLLIVQYYIRRNHYIHAVEIDDNIIKIIFINTSNNIKILKKDIKYFYYENNKIFRILTYKPIINIPYSNRNELHSELFDDIINKKIVETYNNIKQEMITE